MHLIRLCGNCIASFHELMELETTTLLQKKSSEHKCFNGLFATRPVQLDLRPTPRRYFSAVASVFTQRPMGRPLPSWTRLNRADPSGCPRNNARRLAPALASALRQARTYIGNGAC
jgi:hypothetical protein